MEVQGLHLQPFYCMLLIFVLKIPLKMFVKKQEQKQKDLDKKNQESTDYQQEIKNLNAQIEALDPMEDFVKVSKLKRKIIRVNKLM